MITALTISALGNDNLNKLTDTIEALNHHNTIAELQTIELQTIISTISRIMREVKETVRESIMTFVRKTAGELIGGFLNGNGDSNTLNSNTLGYTYDSDDRAVLNETVVKELKKYFSNGGILKELRGEFLLKVRAAVRMACIDGKTGVVMLRTDGVVKDNVDVHEDISRDDADMDTEDSQSFSEKNIITMKKMFQNLLSKNQNQGEDQKEGEGEDQKQIQAAQSVIEQVQQQQGQAESPIGNIARAVIDSVIEKAVANSFSIDVDGAPESASMENEFQSGSGSTESLNVRLKPVLDQFLATFPSSNSNDKELPSANIHPLHSIHSIQSILDQILLKKIKKVLAKTITTGEESGLVFRSESKEVESLEVQPSLRRLLEQVRGLRGEPLLRDASKAECSSSPNAGCSTCGNRTRRGDERYELKTF